MTDNSYYLQDVLTDLLVVILPAAITSDKCFFWVILCIDLLVLIPTSIYIFNKNNHKMDVNRILNANKVAGGVVWAAGAIIWIIGDSISGAVIWIAASVALFLSEYLRIKRQTQDKKTN